MSATPVIFERKATPERILDACEALGDDASGRNVRAWLGGGSLRDITPLVTEWKARRRGADTATPVVGGAVSRRRLPEPVHARLERLERRFQSRVENQAHTGDAFRARWQTDFAALRGELRQLLKEHRPIAADAATFVSLAQRLETTRPPYELNATLGRIDARLTALEASITHTTPALAVVNAINAMLERLDTLSTQVKQLAVRVSEEPAVITFDPDPRLDVLVAGQEALASTIGFCAQRTFYGGGLHTRADRSPSGRARASWAGTRQNLAVVHVEKETSLWPLNCPHSRPPCPATSSSPHHKTHRLQSCTRPRVQPTSTTKCKILDDSEGHRDIATATRLPWLRFFNP